MDIIVPCLSLQGLLRIQGSRLMRTFVDVSKKEPGWGLQSTPLQKCKLPHPFLDVFILLLCSLIFPPNPEQEVCLDFFKNLYFFGHVSFCSKINLFLETQYPQNAVCMKQLQNLQLGTKSLQPVSFTRSALGFLSPGQTQRAILFSFK